MFASWPENLQDAERLVREAAVSAHPGAVTPSLAAVVKSLAMIQAAVLDDLRSAPGLDA